MRVDPRYSAKLLLCLAVVYLWWAEFPFNTKIAVSNLPIALFSAIRFSPQESCSRWWRASGEAMAWPSRLIDWRHVLVNRVLHGVCQQWIERLGDSVIPSNESGAAERHGGVLDRRLGSFWASRVTR